MLGEHHYKALQQQQYGSYLKKANRQGSLLQTRPEKGRLGSIEHDDRCRKGSGVEGDAFALGMLEGGEPVFGTDLSEALYNLIAFRAAWEDLLLGKGTSQERQLRYQLKHKQGIAKPDRRRVNLASRADLSQLLRALLQSAKQLEGGVEQRNVKAQREKLSAEELRAVRSSIGHIRGVVDVSYGGTEHSSVANDSGEIGEESDEGGSATASSLLGVSLSGGQALLDSDMVPLLPAGMQGDGHKANQIQAVQLIVMFPHIERVLKALDPQFTVPNDVDKRYAVAAKAISAYRTPSDYVLKALAMTVAVLGGLTCGLLTGILFYLFIASLMPAVLPLAIVLGSLVGIAGLIANYNYFSKTIEKFLQKLCKQGGLSGYIDKDGQHAKISMPTRFFLGFTALLSLSVGISTAAFSLMSLQHILLELALLAPMGLPLSTALMGVLAAGIGLAMSIIVFWEFVNAAPKLSLPHAREQLGAMSRMEHSPVKILGYILKSLFVLFVLFGLYMLVFSGLHTLAGGIIAVMTSLGATTALSTSIGTAVAWVICIASFSAQLLFVSRTTGTFFNFTVGKIKGGVDHLRARFSRDASAPALLQEGSTQCTSSSLTLSERVRHSAVVLALKEGLTYIAIALNAAGNAALVIQMNVIACLSGVACFFMSASSNLIPPDTWRRERRAKLDQDMIQLFKEQQAVAGGTHFGAEGRRLGHSPQPGGSSRLFRSSGMMTVQAPSGTGLRKRTVSPAPCAHDTRPVWNGHLVRAPR